MPPVGGAKRVVVEGSMTTSLLIVLLGYPSIQLVHTLNITIKEPLNVEVANIIIDMGS